MNVKYLWPVGVDRAAKPIKHVFNLSLVAVLAIVFKLGQRHAPGFVQRPRQHDPPFGGRLLAGIVIVPHALVEFKKGLVRLVFQVLAKPVIDELQASMIT